MNPNIDLFYKLPWATIKLSLHMAGLVGYPVCISNFIWVLQSQCKNQGKNVGSPTWRSRIRVRLLGFSCCGWLALGVGYSNLWGRAASPAGSSCPAEHGLDSCWLRLCWEDSEIGPSIHVEPSFASASVDSLAGRVAASISAHQLSYGAGSSLLAPSPSPTTSPISFQASRPWGVIGSFALRSWSIH